LLDSGLLTSVHKSVVRIESAPRTLEAGGARCALVISTDSSPGRRWKARRTSSYAATEPIHFAVPHGIHLDPDPMLCSIRRLRFGRATCTPRGRHQLASPARLAFDLAAFLPIQDHVSVVEQLIARVVARSTNSVPSPAGSVMRADLVRIDS
jgi:hypothetical protein